MKRALIQPLCGLLIVLAAFSWLGCGGAGNANGAASGRLLFQVDWPSRGRLLPIAADSIKLEFELSGTPVHEPVIIPRPTDPNQTTTSTTITDLPVGTLLVRATAYPKADGTGVPQASGSDSIAISPDGTAQKTITMATTISTVSITPDPISVGVGLDSQVSMTAKDSLGRVVLVTPSKIIWNTSDATKATVASNGTSASVHGVAEGNATISVTETESVRGGNTTVTVSAQNDPGYEYVTQWGAQGVGPGQFSYPLGIAIDNQDNLYVADYGNNRIQVFTREGQFVRQWGVIGHGDGQFSGPLDISLNTDQSVAYVADGGNNRIQMFSLNGDFLLKWGTSGTGNSQFTFLTGVGVDSNGYVYASDDGYTDNDRIQKFDVFGSYVTQWPVSRSPSGIAANRDGHVYVSRTFDQSVEDFSPSGTHLLTIYYYGPEKGVYEPRGVCADNAGSILVVDRRYCVIQKYDSNGNHLVRFGGVGSGPGLFNYPIGIAADSRGYVFVSDSWNHRIQVFRPRP